MTVVNDAYNANPESVRAALDALVAVAGERRTWAVLGEMRELGEGHDVEHEAAGRAVARLGIDRLVVVGEAARPMLRGAGLEGSPGEEAVLVPDVDAAIDLLCREVLPGRRRPGQGLARRRSGTRAPRRLLEPTGGDAGVRLILVAAMVGLFIGLLGTPAAHPVPAQRHGYAQAIRDESDGHYPDHEAKRGTPSMGGLIIVGGTVAGLRGGAPLHLAQPDRLGVAAS